MAKPYLILRRSSDADSNEATVAEEATREEVLAKLSWIGAILPASEDVFFSLAYSVGDLMTIVCRRADSERIEEQAP